MKKALVVLSIPSLLILGVLYLLLDDYSDLKDKVDTQATEIERLSEQLSPEMMELTVQRAIDQYEYSKKLENLEQLATKYQYAETLEGTTDRIYGSPDAEISIIEFSDIECPYCKKFHSTPKNVVDSAGGKVNWVWKHLPLSFHNPAAKDLAVLSECVARVGGNQKFWMFTDLLFKHTKGNGQGIDDTSKLISELMIDQSLIDGCLTQDIALNRVESDMQFAAQAGVTGTPSVFLIHHPTEKVIKMPGFISEQQLRLGIKQLKAQISQ